MKHIYYLSPFEYILGDREREALISKGAWKSGGDYVLDANSLKEATEIVSSCLRESRKEIPWTIKHDTATMATPECGCAEFNSREDSNISCWKCIPMEIQHGQCRCWDEE